MEIIRRNIVYIKKRLKQVTSIPVEDIKNHSTLLKTPAITCGLIAVRAFSVVLLVTDL